MKSINMAALLFLLVAGAGCKKNDLVSRDSRVVPQDFLTDEKYEKLVIEIAYVDGYEPTAEAVYHLQLFLSKRLYKPKGIEVKRTKIPSPGVSAYSLDKIRETEKKYRTQYTKKDELTAYLFFADAGYDANSNVQFLGLAYAPTSAVIFEKTVRDHSGGLNEPSTHALEATIMVHEFGHLLGLVNNGIPMHQHHQDVANGHHCTDNNCVMYYATETTDILAILTGNNIPDLDVQCINDLRMSGGK